MAIEVLLCSKKKKKKNSRGAYAKYTPSQQAKIGEYASIHGNLAAVRRFSKELGAEIKENSVRIWKAKYRAEQERTCHKGRGQYRFPKTRK